VVRPLAHLALQRRDPIPLGAQEPQLPAETPLVHLESPPPPVELVLTLCDRARPLAQRLLQRLELFGNLGRTTVPLFSLEHQGNLTRRTKINRSWRRVEGRRGT